MATGIVADYTIFERTSRLSGYTVLIHKEDTLKIELTETEIGLILRGLDNINHPESKSVAASIRKQIEGDLTGKTFLVAEEDFIQERNKRMMAGTVTAVQQEWNPNDPRNW